MRLAQWTEVDQKAQVWTIPAARMKANREHQVPLSRRALDVLDAALSSRDDSGLLFPNPHGKPLSDMTLSKLIKEQGIEAVPHGFRSSFPRLGGRGNRPSARSGRGGARAPSQ